jgi:hypothetical protein
MKSSCLNSILSSLGLAIASIFCVCTLAIAQPFPSATVWIAQIPIEQPAPNLNPSAQSSPSPNLSAASDKAVKDKPAKANKNNAPAPPEAKQAQSGGPYDLKTIEESYRSLYGS